MRLLKLGYFFWGHLTDKTTPIAADTPDGNAWYSTSIIDELSKRGNEVFRLSLDLDSRNATFSCESFNLMLRERALHSLKNVQWTPNYTLIEPPELDAILLEWRFPIPKRNTLDCMNSQSFSPDLLIQTRVIETYAKTTPIVILDLDHKLTPTDEQELADKNPKKIIVFETALTPRKGIFPRVSVQIPFWMRETLLPMTKQPNPLKTLVYVGNRYERDDVINDYIVPFSKKNPYTVWFYGNWRKYQDKYDELFTILNWREIQYHHRIGHSEFRKAYSDALACPLLAKRSYFESGFVTARIQEALYFGTIPIGFQEHKGISKYLFPQLIVDKDPTSMESTIAYLRNMTLDDRDMLRKRLWRNLEFMDVSYFVDTFLKETIE